MLFRKGYITWFWLISLASLGGTEAGEAALPILLLFHRLSFPNRAIHRGGE